MLRLECGTGPRARFWSIERNGTTIVVRWGRVGAEGQSKTKRLGSRDAALRVYRTGVRAKLRDGYRVPELRPKRRTRKPGGGGLLTAEAILEELDRAQHEDYALSIAGLDWKYGGARLHAFSDGKRRWALVLEEITYPLAPSSGRAAEDAFFVVLRCVGNAARGAERRHFLRPMRNPTGGAVFYADEEEDVSFLSQRLRPDVRRLLLHDHAVRVPHDAASYLSCGLRLRVPPSILKYEVMVWLVERHRDRIFASAEELRARVRADVPEVLCLDEWSHPDFFQQLPSETPTFKMLAEVLASGDPRHWKPKGRPNTHWSKQRD